MNTINPAELLIPEIRQQLIQRQFADLQPLLVDVNPIDLADVLNQFAPEEQVIILRSLDSRRALVVFEELDLLAQEFILHHMDDASLATFLKDVSPNVLHRMVHKLPQRTVRKMETHLRREQMESIRIYAPFPPTSVGALMQTDIVSLKPNMTAREAMDHLRARLRVRQSQELNAVYVINEEGSPIGALSLRTLLAAPLDSQIMEIMIPAAVIRLSATLSQKEAAKLFSRYKLSSAPVVDDQNRLVGVLSSGEMMRVIQREATDDIQKLGAVETLDEPYFKIAFSKMVRKRGAWLCVLFLGEMLTATAMAYFEKEIARAVVLALFIPLIISSGGNSGSQAATLIVRAMALREIGFKDWWRVMRREFAAGLALGCILGTLGFLRIYLWSQFTPLYGPHYLLVALTVACALVLVVLWGSLTGSILPIILRRLGLDPAVVSAPFVATLVDVTGLVIYFMTGMLILKGTLL